MTRKDDILATATRLLAVKGYSQTSMGELARLTGVAHGTVFYHFRNKEELFLAILEGFKAEIIAEYEEHRQALQSMDGLARMEAAVSFHLDLAGRMSDRFLLLHRHDAYEFSQVNPGCREQLESIYECLIGMFEGAVTTGQADGTIDRRLNARRTALIVFSMVDGLVRFSTYSLYDAGSLYGDLITALRRMLQPLDREGG